MELPTHTQTWKTIFSKPLFFSRNQLNSKRKFPVQTWISKFDPYLVLRGSKINNDYFGLF